MNYADRYISYHRQEAARVNPKGWQGTGHMRKDFTPAQKRRMQKKHMSYLNRWASGSWPKVPRDS